MAAKLGTVDEYIYFWDKLLSPVALDSLCEAVGWGSLVVLTVRSSCFVSISAFKPIE